MSDTLKTICFLTRCHPKRQKMREICIASVKSQTCDDYEHFLYFDDKTEEGYGTQNADISLRKAKPLNGRYIMVLDDDDVLVDDDFVADFKKAISKDDPDVVIFKGHISWLGAMPSPDYWGKPPEPCHIGSFCFAVKKELWDKYIESWDIVTGDGFFIRKCYDNTSKVLWLDRLVAGAQRISGGKGE